MRKQTNTMIKSLVFVTSLMVTSFASAEQALTEIKSKFFDDFFVAPGIALSDFKKIYIEEVTAKFDKDWLRDNSIETDKRYRERILERYPSLFKEILVETIKKNSHFSVADKPDEDTLTLFITINDLDIYAPDGNNPSTRKFVKNVGRAELIADMKSSSGKMLAQVKDTRETRDREPKAAEYTNSLLNERDFKWLMKLWAKQLAEHIEKN